MGRSSNFAVVLRGFGLPASGYAVRHARSWLIARACPGRRRLGCLSTVRSVSMRTHARIAEDPVLRRSLRRPDVPSSDVQERRRLQRRRWVYTGLFCGR